MICFCQSWSGGRTKEAAASLTRSTSQPLKRTICATEKAASARGAGSVGSRSSASSLAGWFVRSPSSRAATSVPKRDVGVRPAARVPSAKALASAVRPRAATRRASSSWSLRGVSGAATTAGSVCAAAARSSASSPRVTVSSARKAAGSCPSRRISAAAHDAGLAASATPAGTSVRSATRRRRRRAILVPSIGAVRRRFSLGSVRFEIQPPADDGVAEAIRRAVRASNSLLLDHPAYRSRWRRAGLDYATARPRRRRGAARA